MKTIIVIPTYNEAENIVPLVQQIFDLSIDGLEIIVVDDNSPDNTAALLEEHCHDLPVHIIKRQTKSGLGSAYIEGFKKALSLGAKNIFEMDADFSHDPKDIPRLLEAATGDIGLVIGSRKIAGGNIIGWGPIRTCMSTGAMWFSRLLLGLQAKDVTSGFRCFDAAVLTSFALDDITSNGYAFQEELLYRTEQAGFAVKEVPVTFVDRQKGKSKLSKKDIVEFFIVMIRLRLKK